ncbi:hypothetical protein [Streptomyces sp. NPDC002324]
MASSTISPRNVTAPLPSPCAASTTATSSAQRASSAGPFLCGPVRDADKNDTSLVTRWMDTCPF